MKLGDINRERIDNLHYSRGFTHFLFSTKIYPMVENFDCPSCGAPIVVEPEQAGETYKCHYCGKSFRLPKGIKIDSHLPDVLTKADFNDPKLVGWETINAHRVTIQTGEDPALLGAFPPSDRVHFVLKTAGYLDDQDMRVKIRFLEGDTDLIHAGLCARYEDGIGGYCVLISAESSYIVGVYLTPEGKEMMWKAIVPWHRHTALKPGLNVTNELRVVLKGEHLSVYLNGVLATSMKDAIYKRGQSHLSVEPSEKSNAKVAFSDLIIYEA